MVKKKFRIRERMRAQVRVERATHVPSWRLAEDTSRAGWLSLQTL